MSAHNAILLILAISWSASGLHNECKEECFGSWKTPEDCEDDDCKYSAEWCASGDEVIFVVRGPGRNGRAVGIGFSKDNTTGDDDVVIGGTRDGKTFVQDSWTSGAWRRSSADKSQDIYNATFNNQRGVGTMHFVRKRKTGDEKNDVDLGCQYFLYAYGELRANGIRKPQFEAVSRMRICLCSSNDINPTSTSSTHIMPSSKPSRQPKPTPMFMCPSNCSVSRENCENDLECRPLWDTYHSSCRNIVEWNGHGRSPQCSDECKQSVRNLAANPHGMLYSCCYCDDRMCRQGKMNLKDMCNVSPSESEMCTKMRSACGGSNDDDHDNNRGRCPSCTSHELSCKKNATCKMLLGDAQMKCKDIFEWEESSGESEPMCTDECREAIMKLHSFGGDRYHCCSCGNITDDNDDLDDLHSAIHCRQRRRNMRLCFNDTMPQPMMCRECDTPPEMHSCFDVMNMCLRDRSCRMLMEGMERECKVVTTWDQCMNKPVCPDRCSDATANFFNHRIGRFWRNCDCRMPRRNNIVSLSRDPNFERNCRRSQSNMRTFCFYQVRCRDGQEFKCNWLNSVCSKDRSCKELYDDREQKCASVLSWTEERRTPPMCSNECKEANTKLMRHKIWMGNAACDCGDFFNKSVREIRQSEQCIRGRINMILHCKGALGRGGVCPKDPCEPETCKNVKDQCTKSTVCRQLYEDWEEKCMSVWNSTTNTCPDECRNATYELQKDLHGRNFAGCECGLYHQSNPAVAVVGQCYERQSKLREICGFNDASQCQNCGAKKMCPRSCERIFSRCSNDANCSMAFRNYQMMCKNIAKWNTSLDMPMCTEKCKKALDELITDAIGRHMKCCRCNNGNKQCAHERRNVGFFCELDLNNAKECQNNRMMCRDGTNDRDMMDDENEEPRDTRNQRERDEEDEEPRDTRNQRERDEEDEEPRDTRNQRERDEEENQNDDENRNAECERNQRTERSNTNNRNQFGEMMMMEPPPICSQFAARCREDKCCRKALYEANYYCREVMFTKWKNGSLTPPPVCSDACINSIEVVYNDPIGKNIRCCDCGKSDNIDQNDFVALRTLIGCRSNRRNMNTFCNLSERYNCSRPTREDRFEDVCSVGSCDELTERCQKSETCKPLFDSWMEHCGNVVTANLSSRPICSGGCKQAVRDLFSDPLGSKLKCCDCGRLSLQQLSQISPMDRMPPMPPMDGRMPPMRPVNTSRPTVSTRPPTTPPMPSMMPPMPSMMPPMSSMMDSKSPVGCYIARVNMERYCNLTDDECTDCKQQVCPRSCEEVLEKCRSDAVCSTTLENYSSNCSEVRSWNGSRSTRPTCSRVCRRRINELLANPITRSLKCCRCNGTDRDERMRCALRKRNIERVCNVTMDSSGECRRNREECNDTRRMESNVNREDQCSPRPCQDWEERCARNRTCTKYRNEAMFHCHNVMNWLDGQPRRPVCTRQCQRAIDRLSSVTKRMMGGNIWCCTCGDYFNLRDNSLRGIRKWATCRMATGNVKRFCKPDCPDCNRRQPPMGGNREQSCNAAARMCDGISECRTMRGRIMSACSDVIMWERDDGRRPQCSDRCRQAIMAMEGSRYGRTQQCCDCEHDDMTAPERRRCQQHRRNFETICGMRRDTCGNNQTMPRTNDCFNHMERCNRDMQCRDYFFNYTDKCAKELSADRMRPHQGNMCKEAAEELFKYKRFGENITRCECHTYPELCKDLFKNRFLLDTPCMRAEERCRNNTACSALLTSHNSCKVMNGSCSLSCRAKAVLLYRHRLGRNWWQLCRPHNFEQVCFTLY